MLSAALVCWTISLVILIPVIWYYIIRRKRVSNKIVVDHSGLLFYNSKNEVVEHILYIDLRSSKQNFDIYTVTPVGSGMIPLLEVTVQQKKKEDEIRRIDMNLPLLVVKNKVMLFAHFIHGISVFRPDLKVDPMTLRTFSINPNTWEIHKSKGISKGGWFLLLTVFIVLGVILGITRLLFLYKTGN